MHQSVLFIFTRDSVKEVAQSYNMCSMPRTYIDGVLLEIANLVQFGDPTPDVVTLPSLPQ